MISERVREPTTRPLLAELAAAGPRAVSSPSDYALVVEAVREGYLLHYGEPRLVADPDPDLALLAGDYLYALGLERLAGLEDLEAVGELSDLISLSAQLHAERRPADAGALWLAASVAIGCGGGPAHARAKDELRRGAPTAAVSLGSTASAAAEQAGLTGALREAADSIDFPLDLHS